MILILHYLLALFRDTVTAFYSAGMLLDVCLAFGEMNENLAQQQQYFKLYFYHILLGFIEIIDLDMQNGEHPTCLTV